MPSPCRRTALVVLVPVLGLPLASPAAAQQARPVLRAPEEVAPGGRLVVRATGAGPSAVLERARGRAWFPIGPLAADGTRTLRPAAEGRVVLRVRDGERISRAARVVVRPLVLAAGGDVNLGDVPGAQIARNGPGWPWASVGPTLRAADLAFVNLECAVSTRGRPEAKSFAFRGRPSSLFAAARSGGVDVVNLANNHAGDYGRPALLDTLRTARAAGIAPVGAGHDLSSAVRPVVVERLGLRVAFVGFSEILPFAFRARPGVPGTAWAFPDQVARSVRAARRRADVVVATFHWGAELARQPGASQRRLAGIAFANGATTVIGAHPHVLQPIGMPAPRRLVAWSLGNFVFGANSPGTNRTGILLLRLGARGVLGRRFLPARIVGGRPILTGSSGLRNGKIGAFS